MRFLVFDVFPRGINFGNTDGKNAIPALPCEVLQGRPFRFHPHGRTAFQLFDYERGVLSPRKAMEEMDMIASTANNERRAFQVGEDTTEVAMQF